MKKWFLGILCLSLAFIFAGCGSMKMDTSLHFNSDKSGEFQMRMALQGALAGLLTEEDGEGNFDKWDKVSGARVREYDDEAQHIFEVTLPFKDPAQLEKALAEMGYTVKFQKRSTPIYHHYLVNFAYPQEWIEDIKESSTTDEDTAEFFSQEELDNLVNSMLSFKASISLPGEITDTNAPAVNGQVASWTQRPRQLDSSKVFQVSSRELNWPGIMMMTCLSCWWS